MKSTNGFVKDRLQTSPRVAPSWAKAEVMTPRQIPPGMDRPTTYDYEGLKRLAYKLYKEHGEQRTVETLIALSSQNDPFHIGPARQADAKWFTKLWTRFGVRRGGHLRRMHYWLVSQERVVPMPDGTPYENSNACWQKLLATSTSARYLNLVPYNAFVDRRNAEPIINIRETGKPVVEIDGDELEALPDCMPDPPQLSLNVREPTQRYQIEIWAEKTTMNDILVPLAVKYGINYITGQGELSITHCHQCAERAKRDRRPLRILYVSDFDPAGQSMPVAVARKIEFLIHNSGLDLNVQVRPVVLTKEQIRHYRLPRTPIKDTERRGAAFEERHGAGATELDALEALHPGELEKILEEEITRYYDDTLAKRTTAKAKTVTTILDKSNAEIHARHEDEIEELREEYADVVAAHEAWLERAETVWRAIEDELEAERPDLSKVKWPEPNEGDEDPNPLFDSKRDYVEQIDAYKEFQGKPTERRPGTGGSRYRGRE
jgi:hypothetical protein